MATSLWLERELAGVMTLPDLVPLVDGVQRLVGASGSTLFSFDGLGAVATQGGSLEEAMTGYTPDLFPEDALQRWALGLPASTFISDGSDHEGKRFDLEAHIKSRPYADFYRPRDIAFVMGVWPSGLPYGSPQMFGLLLTKPLPFQPFRAEAIAQLKQLEIPLRAAAKRIARFRAVEHRADVIGQLLERPSRSLVLWNPERQLAWVSSKAQRQLENRLRRGDLERAAQLALQQLHLPRGTSDPLLGRPRVLRSESGAPLRVTFSWVPGADRRRWLLAELEDCSGPRAALALLTPAEARVLGMLVRGLSNAEICEQLRISNETVKTHLQRMFAKLGVNSRAKAARIANEAATQGSLLWDIGAGRRGNEPSGS